MFFTAAQDGLRHLAIGVVAADNWRPNLAAPGESVLLEPQSMAAGELRKTAGN